MKCVLLMGLLMSYSSIYAMEPASDHQERIEGMSTTKKVLIGSALAVGAIAGGAYLFPVAAKSVVAYVSGHLGVAEGAQVGGGCLGTVGNALWGRGKRDDEGSHDQYSVKQESAFASALKATGAIGIGAGAAALTERIMATEPVPEPASSGGDFVEERVPLY